MKGKWTGLVGALAGAAAIGSALTGIYMDWKEQRAVKEIRKAKREIIDNQQYVFRDIMASNDALLKEALKRSEG